MDFEIRTFRVQRAKMVDGGLADSPFIASTVQLIALADRESKSNDIRFVGCTASAAIEYLTQKCGWFIEEL